MLVFVDLVQVVAELRKRPEEMDRTGFNDETAKSETTEKSIESTTVLTNIGTSRDSLIHSLTGKRCEGQN